MYGKVVNLKFANMEEAKLAASFFTENIASKISALKIIGFNVFIGKQGDLNLLVKFEDVSSIKLFEQKYPQINILYLVLNINSSRMKLINKHFFYGVIGSCGKI